MRCFIGIDLGSTTTKAVVIDENRTVLGRGITNSRSNYDTAATIAKQEALLNARFYLFRQALGTSQALNGELDAFIDQLERDFRLEQYLEQLADLEATCQRNVATARFGDSSAAVGEALGVVFKRLTAGAPALFAPGAKSVGASAVSRLNTSASASPTAAAAPPNRALPTLRWQVASRSASCSRYCSRRKSRSSWSMNASSSPLRAAEVASAWRNR